MESRTAPGEPTVAASVFLLCDVVGRDAHSGKWILTGLFDTVWVERFPAAHASMDVFFRIWLRGGDAGGARCVGRIAYRTPAGQQGELPGFVLAPSATGLAEGSVRVQQFPLPQSGSYEFELSIDGTPVSRTWLRAEALPDRAATALQ